MFWRKKVPPFWTAAVLLAAVVACWGWFTSDIVLHAPRCQNNDTPKDHGYDFEQLNIRSSGLSLSGWFVPADKKTNKTIVVVHGWGGNKSDILPQTLYLNKRGGYNLFYFDLRGHGQSEGRVTSFGKLETDDLRAAIKFLREDKKDSSEITGIYGFSLGASVALTYAADDTSVKAVVAESPFCSFDDVLARYARLFYRMPKFPLLDITRIFVMLRLGFNPQLFSPCEYVASISPRPVFYIYGLGDKRALFEEEKELYEMTGEPKYIMTVEGAGHGEAYMKNGPEYEKRILEFFGRYMKREG